MLQCSKKEVVNLMRKNAKVSIIVPCYNVEQFLPKCIESLINQTYKNIEIICINDGSKDKTIDILKAYSKNDKRLVIIDKKMLEYLLHVMME